MLVQAGLPCPAAGDPSKMNVGSKDIAPSLGTHAISLSMHMDIDTDMDMDMARPLPFRAMTWSMYSGTSIITYY